MRTDCLEGRDAIEYEVEETEEQSDGGQDQDTLQETRVMPGQVTRLVMVGIRALSMLRIAAMLRYAAVIMMTRNSRVKARWSGVMTALIVGNAW